MGHTTELYWKTGVFNTGVDAFFCLLFCPHLRQEKYVILYEIQALRSMVFVSYRVVPYSIT